MSTKFNLHQTIVEQNELNTEQNSKTPVTEQEE